MRPRAASPPAAVLLAGSAILAGWGLALVPKDLSSAPETPFDRSDPALAGSFRLMAAAARSLPPDASVTVIAEPRDAVRETALYDCAVALFPGRRVLPAAQWDSFTPRHELEADYVLVAGPMSPGGAPGPLVAEVPGGRLFHRRRP